MSTLSLGTGEAGGGDRQASPQSSLTNQATPQSRSNSILWRTSSSSKVPWRVRKVLQPTHMVG